MQIKSKLPKAGTTIFTVMSALAKEYNAINLSQGFPDFGCSPHLAELANKYISQGFNQYAPMPGVRALRERIAEIIEVCYNSKYDIEKEITVTAGATQAIYTALAAFVRPGDEVIVFEPAYDCYIPGIELQGGKAVVSKLTDGTFKINWEEVRAKVNKKTRAVILNSPHNPTGIIIDKSDLAELEKIVAGTDILVISDEVYEHMVFDAKQHFSICTSKALKERSILVSSFGKTIHTTGWKIGYVAAPEAIMTEFRKVHQFLVFVVNHPLQLAIADFLSDHRNFLELRNFYEQKRDLFRKLMSTSRFEPLPCQGTYFQLMKYDRITSENDAELAVRLTKEKKVAAIPLSAFYSNGEDVKLLRFCFAKKEETLEKAAEILCRL